MLEDLKYQSGWKLVEDRRHQSIRVLSPLLSAVGLKGERTLELAPADGTLEIPAVLSVKLRFFCLCVLKRVVLVTMHLMSKEESLVELYHHHHHHQTS